MEEIVENDSFINHPGDKSARNIELSHIERRLNPDRREKNTERRNNKTSKHKSPARRLTLDRRGRIDRRKA